MLFKRLIDHTLKKHGYELIRIPSDIKITTSCHSDQPDNGQEWSNPFEVLKKKWDEVPVSRIERKKTEDIEKLKKYQEKIKKTKCPDFFSKIADLDEDITVEFENYLVETDIEIKKSEEKEMINLANEMFDNSIMTEEVVERLYKEKEEEAAEKKMKDLDKFKGYEGKIDNSKFSKFFEQFLK